MGFADEVTQVNSQKNTSVTEVLAAAEANFAKSSPEAIAATEPKAAAPVYDTSALFADVALPVGEKPVEAKATETAPAAKEVIPSSIEAKNAPKIRIAGVEFDSVEDAIKYADTYAQAKEQEEAYQKGFSKAKEEATPKVPAVDFDKELEELLFKDPAAALKRLRESTKKEVFEEYNNLVKEQQQTQQIEANRRNFWDTFAKTNPELSSPGVLEYADMMVKKHWNEVQSLNANDAIKKIADITRTQLKIAREAALPQTELPSGPAVVPGASGNATSAQPASTEEKILDFVSQVNKLRRRK